MTTKERTARLTALGYRLVKSYKCPIRNRRMPFATRPVFTGPTCVFETLEQVERYIGQVEQIREWQR